MTQEPQPDSLFTHHALEDLAALIGQATKLNARRLLLLAGQYPVCRVGSQLMPPLSDERLHFNQTQNLVLSILSPSQIEQLDNNGEINAEITIGAQNYSVNVFFGDGSHNVVIYLKD